MFNVIRMDLCHMMRTKCFWFMMLVTAVFLFMMGYNMREDVDITGYVAEQEAEGGKESMDEEELQELRIIADCSLENQVLVKTIAGKSGQTMPLLVCLFATLFCLRERKNGFIKNVAGGMRHRWYLWVSKIVVMLVYILLNFLLTILCMAVTKQIFHIPGATALGMDFWKAMGLQVLLYLVLSMFCITIVNLSRSVAVSIPAAVFVSVGFPALFIYNLEGILGAENAMVHQYMAGYQIRMVSQMPGGEELKTAALVIIAGFLFYSAVNYLLLEKRDVC